MENEKSLFSLDVDATGKTHLKDTAKWAKFLAVTGFITLGLILIFSIVTAFTTQKKLAALYDDQNAGMGDFAGTIFAGVICVVIYFFPCFFLLRFANKIQPAVDADDATLLNASFKNLKITFRYVGILTIIFLVLFLIALLGSL